MKTWLKHWLAIDAIAAENEALGRRIEELESRLNEIHPPLTLSAPRPNTASERLRPRNWSEAKKLLEGESNAG
ncbi:MAG: hypothetical protein ACRD19_15005 [Terriglobia bacterium]